MEEFRENDHKNHTRYSSFDPHMQQHHQQQPHQTPLISIHPPPTDNHISNSTLNNLSSSQRYSPNIYDPATCSNNTTINNNNSNTSRHL